MYRRVLVALEHSAYDATIVAHVRELARCCHSSVVLIHVADGWAARNLRHLDLRESEEMRDDREYIERVGAELREGGLDVDAILANGDPSREIAAAAEREGCDLIAMATHGHGFINDVVRGSVANEVRHRTTVPVLLVRGTKPNGQPAVVRDADTPTPQRPSSP
jgi:nucleotide-binding universal stress UspA family protein